MSLQYYRALMNQGGLNANYLAYKSRVETDGGAISNENLINSKFQFLDDNSIYSNLLFAWDNVAGNKENTSLIETAYNIAETSSSTYDVTQATSTKRPAPGYDFDGGDDLFKAATNRDSIYSCFFRVGSFTLVSFATVLGTASGSTFRTIIRFNSGNMSILVRNAGGFNIYNPSVTLTANTSYLVTFDSSNNIKVYKDGTLADSVSNSRLPQLGGNIYFGSFLSGDFFNGVIESLYYWEADQSANASIIHSNL